MLAKALGPPGLSKSGLSAADKTQINFVKTILCASSRSFFASGLVHAPFFVCGSFTVLFMLPFLRMASSGPFSCPFFAYGHFAGCSSPPFPRRPFSSLAKKKNNILWRAEGEGGNLERKRKQKKCPFVDGGRRAKHAFNNIFCFSGYPLASTELFSLFHSSVFAEVIFKAYLK